MDFIELSPGVLDWAATQVGGEINDVAQKVSKRSAEKIVKGQLTYSQVLKYAKVTGVPLGFLFLDKPPEGRKLPVADFRTTPDANPLGRDFYEVFDDIEFKHAWLKERLDSLDAEELPFVGKYETAWPAANELAVELRLTLEFNDAVMAEVRNPDQLFSALADKCEEIGIFVFKNGVVGNNTSKPLSVSQFRGFAIADKICPIIFVNGADAPAAWVFTLAHELAHIWLGDSGVSDAEPGTSNKVENYCNSVAGEFLVPRAKLNDLWEAFATDSDDVKLDIGRRKFRVSKTVVARRAFDIGLISKQVYLDIYNLARKAAKSEKTNSGGDFYRLLAVRNSKSFSLTVANLAVSGNITLGQAGRLLNTNPNHVVKLYEKRNALSI
jgi:Zn-dependent peptidase ImmA (M78 family)